MEIYLQCKSIIHEHELQLFFKLRSIYTDSRSINSIHYLYFTAFDAECLKKNAETNDMRGYMKKKRCFVFLNCETKALNV